MYTKLTLNVNKEVIEKAKKYAKSKNISLSKLIESYLNTLISKKKKNLEFTPLVNSLSGVIKMDKEMDHKKDYTDYLMEKYK